MTPNEVRKAALEMGVPYRKAVQNRCDYLAWMVEHHIDSGDPVFEMLAFDRVEEMVRLKNTLRKREETTDRITDEQIERARQYPVTQLIDFTKGTATAFCHDDRNPSLKLMTRTGRAWCPVCVKYYDAIEVLVQRDGLTFVDAVKSLS